MSFFFLSDEAFASEQLAPYEPELLEIFRTMEDPDGAAGGACELWRGNPSGALFTQVDYCGNVFVLRREREGSMLHTSLHYFPGWLLQALIRSRFSLRFGGALGLANAWLIGEQIDVWVSDMALAQPRRIRIDERHGLQGLSQPSYRIDLKPARWAAAAAPQTQPWTVTRAQWTAPGVQITAAPGVEIDDRPILRELCEQLRSDYLPIAESLRETAPLDSGEAPVEAAQSVQQMALRVRRTQCIDGIAQDWRADPLPFADLDWCQPIQAGEGPAGPMSSAPAEDPCNVYHRPDGVDHLLLPPSMLRGPAAEQDVFGVLRDVGNSLFSLFRPAGLYVPGADEGALLVAVSFDPMRADARYALRVQALSRDSGDVQPGPLDLDDLPDRPPFYRVSAMRTANVRIAGRGAWLFDQHRERLSYCEYRESVVAFDDVPNAPWLVELDARDRTELAPGGFSEQDIQELLDTGEGTLDSLAIVLGFTPLTVLSDLYDLANLISYASSGENLFGRKLDRLEALALAFGVLPGISSGMFKGALGVQQIVTRGAMAGSLLCAGTQMHGAWDESDKQYFSAVSAPQQ